MKKINKTTAFAVIATLSIQSVSTAFAASDAQKIAMKNKNQVVEAEAKVVRSLGFLRQELQATKEQLLVLNQDDSSGVMAKTNIGAGLSGALLFAISAWSYKNLRSSWMLDVTPALIGIAGAVGLTASHVLALADITLAKQTDGKQIEQQVLKTISALGSLESQLDSEKDRKMVRELIKSVQSINEEATDSAKAEQVKHVLVASSILLTGVTVSSGFLSRSTGKEVLVTTFLGVSSLVSATSGMIGEDKKAIIKKIDNAIDAIIAAEDALRSES